MKDYFPFGKRGEYPFSYRCSQKQARDLVMGVFTEDAFGNREWADDPEQAAIPGLKFGEGGVECSYSAALVVARILNKPAPVIHPPRESEFPGLQRARDIQLSSRLYPHQKSGGKIMARLAYGILADDCRTGKCRTEICASVLMGADRNLVITRGMARRGWAREIWATVEEDSLILDGRAADRAWWFKSERWVRRYKVESNRCKEHGELIGIWTDGEWCSLCNKQFQAAFREARWVIGNYDIMIAQSRRGGAGETWKDRKLWGWSEELAGMEWDLALVDEAHDIRGWDKEGSGHSRRERVDFAISPAIAAHAPTATPEYGYRRDIWGILNTVSAGLYSPAKGKGVGKRFAFDARYCDGGKTGRNDSWFADGTSMDEEWQIRRDADVLQRPNEEIHANLPPTRRQVIEVEPEGGFQFIPGKKGSKETRINKSLRQALKFTLPRLQEMVLEELLSGRKVVIGTRSQESADTIFTAFKKLDKDKKVCTALRNRGYKVWLVPEGLPGDARDAMAVNYTEHTGCGVWVSTHGMSEVGITLGGATSVYHAEFGIYPMKMHQFELRPRIIGAPPITYFYFCVMGTYHEKALAQLIDKLNNIAKNTKLTETRATLETLTHDESTTSDVLDELTSELDMMLEFCSGEGEETDT